MELHFSTLTCRILQKPQHPLRWPKIRKLGKVTELTPGHLLVVGDELDALLCPCHRVGEGGEVQVSQFSSLEVKQNN